MPGRKTSLLLQCAALLLCAASAFAQPVRIAVSRGPVSLPIYVADAMGYFQREGVQVVLKDCSSGRDCMTQLQRGEADIATSAELVVVLENIKKPDLAILTSLTASWKQIRLVGHRGAGIDSHRGLVGKRIGTPKGTSAEYFLYAWLNYHRIDPASVDIVGMPPGALAGALEKRQVDAIAIWEPEVSRAVQLLRDEAVLLPAPRIYTQHFVLATSRANLSRLQADAVRVLRALGLAETQILARPELASQILQERMKIDIAAQGWEAQNFRLQLSPLLLETMQEQLQWAVRQGLAANIDAATRDVRDSIAPGPLREARPAAVSLR